MGYYHRWRAQSRYMVTVHLFGTPPDDVFDTCMKAHREHNIVGELVYTASDASLKSLQRKALIDYANSAPGYRASVIITSTVPRGVATALSWFYKGLKAFRPDEGNAACDFLGMSPQDNEWAKSTLNELLAEGASAASQR
jgi:hypothetical protein